RGGGVAVVPARRHCRGPAGLFLRQVRRQVPVGRWTARVRREGAGNGHFTGITAWLTYAANAIVTAMGAVSFGSYATEMFTGDSKVWAKVFAALIIIAMTAVNVVGSKLVANAQTVIVYVVLGILSFFAVVTQETGASALILWLAILAAGA